jgi:glycosyltransferase involved in cell wall biosynthesis
MKISEKNFLGSEDLIKVLHVTSSLNGAGGIQGMILNYYKHMNHKEITFDIIVHGMEEGTLEPIFKTMGSNIYHVIPKSKSIFKNLLQIYRIIKNENYDIIHSHQKYMAIFPLFLAKICGIKVRISHCHSAFEPENFQKKVMRLILSILTKKVATHWFACGKDAGIFMYGKRAWESGRVTVINNAIDTTQFTYNVENRIKWRKELGLEGKFVIGNVARFSYQKNHEFLIKIFADIVKLYKNAVLLLIGTGELEPEIRMQVNEYKLNNSVIFLGERNDVSELLQAMDVFLLPTRYEGLGIVYVESQAAGLPTFASDIVVPKEVGLTELIHFVSLEESTSKWAKEVLKYQETCLRKNTIEEIKKKGYDIYNESNKLERFYYVYSRK